MIRSYAVDLLKQRIIQTFLTIFYMGSVLHEDNRTRHLPKKEILNRSGIQTNFYSLLFHEFQSLNWPAFVAILAIPRL